MPASQAKVSPIEVVVFDLRGVLVDWNPRYLYRRLFNDDAAMEHFLSEVCSPEWNERHDAGRPWYEALAELTARHPDQVAMITAYHQRWPEMLGGDMPETVELLKERRMPPVAYRGSGILSGTRSAIALQELPWSIAGREFRSAHFRDSLNGATRFRSSAELNSVG